MSFIEFLDYILDKYVEPLSEYPMRNVILGFLIAEIPLMYFCLAIKSFVPMAFVLLFLEILLIRKVFR